MIYAAQNYGSRGSAYVLEGSDFMQREPMEENIEGRSVAIVAQSEDDFVSVSSVPVKPLPERDLWFESVWAKYRERWDEK